MKSNSFANIVDLAQERSTKQADGVAFTFSDFDNSQSHLTYRELDTRARAIASSLISHGLQGKRALLLYMPGFDYLSAFYGCLYAGVVAVPAYPPDPQRIGRTLPRLMNIINDSQSSAVLTTQAIDEMAEDLFASAQPDQNLFWLATDMVPKSESNSYIKPKICNSDLAFLQYTSGSTSHPRGVMLSHDNIIANMNLITDELVLQDGTRIVSWLPPYHDMGLIGGMIQPVYRGFHATLMSPLDFLSNPFKWLNVLSEKKATASAGPNFAFDLCVRRVTDEQISKLDLSSWRVAVNGAEPVRADTIQRFAQRFAPCGFRLSTFKPSYGLAEATLYVSGATKSAPSILQVDKRLLQQGMVKIALSTTDDTRSLVSCGEPSSNYQIRIVDSRTKTCLQNNCVGEVWLKHPSVSKGYWNQPEKNSETFDLFTANGEGPFMRSGDLGFIHEKQLYITGRSKDIIIIRGRNHYPQDIEETLENCHPNIRPGCLAAFCLDSDHGDTLAIVAEVKRNQSEQETAETIEAIKLAVAAQHEIGVEVIALIEGKTIPKTSSGKIQRHACKQMFLEGSLDAIHIWQHAHQGNTKTAVAANTPSAERMSFNSFNDLILQSLGLGKTSAWKEDDLLIQHGMDSLIRQELIASLESHIGGRLPDTLINEKTSFRSLLSYLTTNHRDSIISSPNETPVITSYEEIPLEFCSFDNLTSYVEIKKQKAIFSTIGLPNPFFTEHEGIAKETTQIGDRTFANFSSYNYLGLAGDPRIQKAAKDAIDKFGTGVSASRLVSGERPIHRELEREIAQFTGVEDAIVLVGGHSTNVSTIGHLFGPRDLILFDSLSHNSVQQGNQLSGAKLIPFPHNDWKALDQILSTHRLRYEKAVVIIEGVYSMDGDIPDLARFVEVKNRHRAFLMVDEAHSSGVLGKTGRGLAEYAGVPPSSVDIWMGTLSKSFVSCGGYIAGTTALVEYLRYTAPGFVYSVGISPSNAAASLEAIKILLKEPQRVDALRHNSETFLRLAKEAGLNTGNSANSPVIPIIIGNSVSTLLLSQRLLDNGFNVRPIVYPAVEEKLARLRFFMTASHTQEQIKDAVAVIKKELPKCISA